MQNPKERRGYDEDWLQDKLPLTYAYLVKFEKVLRQRSGMRKYFCDQRGKPFAAFYSIYNVGEYTLSPYKVVWGRMGNELAAAVAEAHTNPYTDKKPPVPQETVMFVPCDDPTEAHFICGLLNSCVANFLARSYSTGKSFASAHLLHHVRLPKFDAQDKRHQRLAELSAAAHQLAAEATEAVQKRLRKVEAEIDAQAATVWNITTTELRDIHSSLADLT